MKNNETKKAKIKNAEIKQAEGRINVSTGNRQLLF
jgi:hypothetical protein